MKKNNEDMLSLNVKDFISRIAAKSPVPGGGSVAGVTGALAAALGEMSLNFTRGKKKYAQWAEFHNHLAGRLERIRGMFLDLVYDDMSAYGMYSETSELEDGPGKKEKMELAVAAAIDVPLEMSKLALALLDDLLEFSDKCNQHLVSDLVAAATLAHSTVVLCDLNVRINAGQLDPGQAAELRKSSNANRKRAADLAEKIEANTRQYLQE